MAYIKFKELTKYFGFKTEVLPKDLPKYALEYTYFDEEIIFGYKNSRDCIVFTNKRMYLFDRDVAGIYYKKIHVIPYKSISSGAIDFKSNKVDLLFSLNSGYQIHIKFIKMDHNKKENLKKIYRFIFLQ